MKEVSMKIRPLNDRLLIQRLEEEDTSTGGIIIPDSAKEKQAQGKVIAAGPGKVDDSGKRVKLQVKKGDVVLFSKYGGTDVTLDGREYLIMREDDILGIVEK
jgi:chaperonin GroES